MKSPFRRLRVLCEDRRTQIFVTGLAKRFGIGARDLKIAASPSARNDASKYVLDNFVKAVKGWRAARHGNELVGLLIVIDGDKYGVADRRNELLKRLQSSEIAPITPSDPVAIIVPTWHIETWIAWLCGHRPMDEQTRYNGRDSAGLDVHHKIKQGTYTPRLAIAKWGTPAPDESTYVPSLTDARAELAKRLGV